MPDRIVFEGFSELRRAVKELGQVDATREFKAAGYAAAVEVVIPGAKGRAASLGKMQAKAADTLRGVKTVTGGAVRFGAGFEGAFGSEFGAMQNQPRGTVGGRALVGWNQFEPWRGSGSDAGYFLWPTIRGDSEEIVDKFAEGIDNLNRRLGWS